MSNPFSTEDSDDLARRLDAAVRATLSGDIPDDAVERVKLRARRLVKPETAVLPEPRLVNPRRRISRSVISSLIAVAAALIVIFGLTTWLDQSRGHAFAQVVEKVKAANTVHFETSQRFGRQEEIKGRMYIDDTRYRSEILSGEIVWLSDFSTRQGLMLHKGLKTARKLEITADMTKNFTNPVDQLKSLKLADAERIGEENVQGVRTHVYRLKNMRFVGMGGASETLVWVDVKSLLPKKIVCRETDPKRMFELRYEDFVWNEPLDPNLFSLKIPEGYRLEELEPPRPERSKSPNLVAISVPTAHPDFGTGVISSDRVAGSIILNEQGTRLVALMRDPESVAAREFWPRELRQWDLQTGKWRWKMEVAGASCVAETRDGKYLATVIGYEMQLRDADTGKVIRTWTTEKQISPLAFSPTDAVLVAGIAEWAPGGKELPGGVQLWNVRDGGLIRTIPDDKPISFVKYSEDGKLLVTSSNSGPVKLWNTQNGELVRIFPGVLRADFSPDGKLLACPSSDRPTDNGVGTVNVYNVNNGELVRSLTSEKGASDSYLLWVTFSPDGHKLVATDWNGTVTMWNVATGERIATNITHIAGVLVAEFSPDGTTLVTGSEDKMLRLWKLPTNAKEPVPDKK